MKTGSADWGTIASSASPRWSASRVNMPASKQLAEFRNEPYTDFSVPGNRRAMEAALGSVRAQFGREYALRIGAERFTTADKLTSLNPSNTAEVVGIHQKAEPEMAR